MIHLSERVWIHSSIHTSFSILINIIALICTLPLCLPEEPPWILRYCVLWLCDCRVLYFSIFTLWLAQQGWKGPYYL